MGCAPSIPSNTVASSGAEAQHTKGGGDGLLVDEPLAFEPFGLLIHGNKVNSNLVFQFFMVVVILVKILAIILRSR